MQLTWMNLVEPWHLQGLMKGFLCSSSSSRQIRQHLPDSRAKALLATAAERPPVTTDGSKLRFLVS
jgi:hypothetical protein